MTRSAPSNKPVRIKDIAAEAGVSYPVASLALAGKKDRNVRYSEETRLRVLAVAKRLGYRQNRSARNFACSRHGSLAIVAQSVYQFSRMTLYALTRAAMEQDLTVFLDGYRPGVLPRCIGEDMADGVFVFGLIAPEIESALDRVGMPTAWVNTNRTEGRGVITYDEGQGMRMLVEAFARRGRRRIALLHVGTDEHYSVSARYDELHKLSKSLGLEPPRISELDLPSLENGEMDSVIMNSREVDAYIVADRLLPKAYSCCAACGRKIGEDVSVLCYQPDWNARLLSPRCAGAGVDDIRVGQLAMQVLGELIDGKSVGTRVVPYEFAPGDSL
jgi:DNA-binding LacI/PurR family transcriptional regulator